MIRFVRLFGFYFVGYINGLSGIAWVWARGVLVMAS